MRCVILSALLCAVCFSGMYAQRAVKIYNITANACASKTNAVGDGEFVRTAGVVTAVVKEGGEVRGVFVQDEFGDGDERTNDAVYVRIAGADSLSAGDKIEVTGLVVSDGAVREICRVADMSRFAGRYSVEPKKVVFPDDFSDYRDFVGMLLEFDQTLWVTSNYDLERYGKITLSGERLMTPTDVELPGSDEWKSLAENNRENCIILDDGSDERYPDHIGWYDGETPLRTGMMTDGLTAVLTDTERGYVLVADGQPEFYGNERPVAPEGLGDYEIKVCGFNLEYYLADSYGQGYGPDNASEAARQHAKTVAALRAVDADIYGLVEVQTGQKAIGKLCDALNDNTSGKRYEYVDDGSSTNGTYTKCGYIYRSDRVSPVGGIKSNDRGVKNRKKGQAFRMNGREATFVFLINHFKSKSGGSGATGGDADQDDGQGAYNEARVEEALSTVAFAEQCAEYYGDGDVLIMGDLNAYSMEDPVRSITDAGYVNLVKEMAGDDAYSYSYQSAVGLLDHALANSTMAGQVTGCSVFHINADEAAMYGYDGSRPGDDMYRSSDHDPVVVGIRLADDADVVVPDNSVAIVHGREEPGLFTVLNADRHYMKIVSVGGIVMCYTQITSDAQTFDARALGLGAGVYVLQFTEIKAIEPKQFVRKLILTE